MAMDLEDKEFESIFQNIEKDLLEIIKKGGAEAKKAAKELAVVREGYEKAANERATKREKDNLLDNYNYALKLGIKNDKELARIKNRSTEEALEAYEKKLLDTENKTRRYSDYLYQESALSRLDLRLEEERTIARAMSAETIKAQKEALKLKEEAEKKLHAAAEKRMKASETADKKEKKALEKAAQKDEKESGKLQRKGKDQEDLMKRREAVDMTARGPLGQMVHSFAENFKFMKTAEGKKAARDKQMQQTMKAVGDNIKAGFNQINSAIDAYTKNQTSINARLQGISSYNTAIDNLEKVAFSPLLKAEDLYTNLGDLVHSGIAHNVEQRAFFQTVKGGIAETFDVTESYMKRMIRIQQNDSTAARLGMESYLTRWLNEYVENTEYLTNTFDSVASSLFEASAVIGAGNNAAKSLEFEAAVQTWLGTLTGVGFSDESAQSIASALGQLGSGNLDVLNSEMGTLFTMAAASTGQNIGEMLVDGLDADTTNKLLGSVVTFLQTIVNNNANNVTKAEMAKIFGVSMSDLIALSNLNATALETVSKSAALGYEQMYGELIDQFDKLPSRLGIGNILSNLFSNLTYQTGMSIGSSPVAYATWKITDLIRTATGGINIPTIMALGTGVDLETTVENLVQLGVAGASMLGNIGNIVSGVGTAFNGGNLLDKIGVNGSNPAYELKKLGEGLAPTAGPRQSGKQISELGTYRSNTAGEDYQNSAINAAENKAKDKQRKLLQEAEEYDPVLKFLKKEVKLDLMLKAIVYRLGGQFNANGELDTNNLGTLGEAMQAEALAAALAPTVAESGQNTISALESLSNIEGVLTNIRDIIKVTSESGSLTSAAISTSNVNLIMTMSNMADIAANGGLQTIISGEASGLTNLGTINAPDTVSTSINSNNDYLDKIQFADGFKQLVDDVSAIKGKLDNIKTSVSNPISSPSDIEGFNAGGLAGDMMTFTRG